MNELFVTTHQLLDGFDNRSVRPIVDVFSPGRINLIGDHIDYCGGQVFPAAIDYGTALSARMNGGDSIRAVSANQEGVISFDPNSPNQAQRHWGDYVVGVCEQYRERSQSVLGRRLPGLDIAVAGNIPGSCLSSSASLGVGVALLLEACSPNLKGDIKDLVRLVQSAENNFVGVNCGVMDQAAVAMAKGQSAMLLNCSNLEVDYVAVETGRYQLLIADTCKSRELVTSAYNQRRQEVDESLVALQQQFDIASLTELVPSDLEAALPILDTKIKQNRVTHVVTEQYRVQQAAMDLRAGKLDQFGEALNASHTSLKDNYEVTGPELDALIGLLQCQTGVLGARMMGAGFGGCGLALILAEVAEEITERVKAQYETQIGYAPAFYPVELSDGAHIVEER